jgi:hypothetical protein
MFEYACSMHVPSYTVVKKRKAQFSDSLFGKFSIHLVHGCTSKEILGYLGISLCILRHTPHYFESGWTRRWSSLIAPSCLCSTLLSCIQVDHSLLPRFSLLDCQASKPGLAASELPQPWVNLMDAVLP